MVSHLKNVKKVRTQVSTLKKSIKDKKKHKELIDFADALVKDLKVKETHFIDEDFLHIPENVSTEKVVENIEWKRVNKIVPNAIYANWTNL